MLLALGGYEHDQKRQPASGLLIPTLSQFACALTPLDLLVLPGDPGKALHTVSVPEVVPKKVLGGFIDAEIQWLEAICGVAW